MRDVVHLTVALLVLAACGAGDRQPSQPLSSRPVDTAGTAPACGEARLRAFDPGLEGLERVAIEQRLTAGSQPAVERAWACDLAENDQACLDRVRRRATATISASTIDSIDLDGERDGWTMTLEVDGHHRSVNVVHELAVLAEIRRLQVAGHRVTMIEGHVRYRAEGRRALVRYSPPLTRRRWVTELRWPRPSDPLAAFSRLNDEVTRTDLVLERYQLEAGVLTAVVTCP